MCERQKELLVFVFLAAAFLTAAVQAKSPALRIGTIVYFKEKTPIDMFSSEERNRLEALITELWSEQGITSAFTRICNVAQDDKSCGIDRNSSHTLEVRVSPVRLGMPTSGIAISLEMSDPRRSHENEIEVLPVQCTVREHMTQRPIDIQNVEQPAPVIQSVKREKLVRHFARLIFVSCADLVMKSGLNMVEMSAHQLPILSAYPDVVIEKRVGSPDEPRYESRAATDSGSSAVAQEYPSAFGQDGEAGSVAVDKNKEETQYIIHNPASTVILEFGHRRE